MMNRKRMLKNRSVGWCLLVAAFVSSIGGYASETPSVEARSHSSLQEQPTNSTATMVPKDLRAAYIASIQRNAPRAYAAKYADSLTRMMNPGQRFVATINNAGLTITPDDDVWHWRLRTSAVGCENSLTPVHEAVPEMDANRVTLYRGSLEEWYLNGPLGVEQGFVLREAPACMGLKRITLAFEGNLVPRVEDPDGDGRGNAVLPLNLADGIPLTLVDGHRAHARATSRA